MNTFERLLHVLNEECSVAPSQGGAEGLLQEANAISARESSLNLIPIANQLAQILNRAGNTSGASRIYQAIQSLFPQAPAGWIGAASLASRQRRWEDALYLWSQALMRFPDRSQPIWRMGQARAMAALGLAEEAVANLRTALTKFPEVLEIRVLLAQILEKEGRLQDALDVLNDRADLCEAFVPTQFQMLKLLSRRGHNDEAVHRAQRMIQRSAAFDGLPAIARMLPEISEGYQYEQCLTSLQIKLSELTEKGAIDPSHAEQAIDLRFRLLAMQRNFEGLVHAIDQLQNYPDASATILLWRSFAEVLKLRQSELRSGFKVFGIGLSKTGTTSLTVALAQLGYSSAHYQSPYTAEVIDARQCGYFDACSDTPVSGIFEYLYYQFPNSKFVYTVRPISQWIESLRNHHRFHFGETDWVKLKELTARSVSSISSTETSLYFNHADALSAWLVHDSRVRGFFADKPRDRFLVLDIFSGQGWKELCGFLSHPIPEDDFPHENKVK